MTTPTNPADLLRQAADRLTDLYCAASLGPLHIEQGDHPGDVPIVTATGQYLCTSPDDGVRGGHFPADAALIATLWDVADPLAAWLRETADHVGDYDGDIPEDIICCLIPGYREALTVARTILSEAPGGGDAR